MTVETVFLAGTVLSGAISAFCWWRSATVEIAAPQGVKGEGAAWGGPIWSKNESGSPIDLLATLRLQSRWNRYGALAACIAALFAIAKEVSTALST
jgi:hypothetical protein